MPNQEAHQYVVWPAIKHQPYRGNRWVGFIYRMPVVLSRMEISVQGPTQQHRLNAAWKSRSSGPGQSSMALPVNDSTPLLAPNLPVFQSSNIPMSFKRCKTCPLGLAQNRALWTRIFTSKASPSFRAWELHIIQQGELIFGCSGFDDRSNPPWNGIFPDQNRSFPLLTYGLKWLIND